MPGIAAHTARIYAKYEIPTLPLGDNKKPLVSNFKVDALTMEQSRAFMRRRPDADVIGVPDGPLSGIVRLDIDERGEHILPEVIRRSGKPGAMTRTASGKFHLWYADNGERRLTGQPGRRNARPWDDLKVDLCGRGGYAISPPSRFCNGSEYTFEGSTVLDELLRDRANLPKIQGLPVRAYLSSTGTGVQSSCEALAHMREGSGRNNDLFGALRNAAGDLPICLATYSAWARRYNAKYGEPMADAEVLSIVKSVFGYAERGILRSGGHGAWFRKPQAQELARDPYLLALITWLKAENGPASEFLVADGLTSPRYLKWPRERLQRARRRAIEEGWIVQIRAAAPGRAALYRWGPTVGRT